MCAQRLKGWREELKKNKKKKLLTVYHSFVLSNLKQNEIKTPFKNIQEVKYKNKKGHKLFSNFEHLSNLSGDCPILIWHLARHPEVKKKE